MGENIGIFKIGYNSSLFCIKEILGLKLAQNCTKLNSTASYKPFYVLASLAVGTVLHNNKLVDIQHKSEIESYRFRVAK
jgi:hypothetical protein